MQNHSDEINMKQAMALAASPEGQKLISLLRQSGGEDMRKAMEKAAAGDYAAAKQALSALMDTPEVRQLLGQLKGNADG